MRDTRPSQPACEAEFPDVSERLDILAACAPSTRGMLAPKRSVRGEIDAHAAYNGAEKFGVCRRAFYIIHHICPPSP